MSGDGGDVGDQGDSGQYGQSDRDVGDETMVAFRRVADEKEGDAPK